MLCFSVVRLCVKSHSELEAEVVCSTASSFGLNSQSHSLAYSVNIFYLLSLCAYTELIVCYSQVQFSLATEMIVSG